MGVAASRVGGSAVEVEEGGPSDEASTSTAAGASGEFSFTPAEEEEHVGRFSFVPADAESVAQGSQVEATAAEQEGGAVPEEVIADSSSMFQALAEEEEAPS